MIEREKEKKDSLLPTYSSLNFPQARFFSDDFHTEFVVLWKLHAWEDLTSTLLNMVSALLLLFFFSSSILLILLLLFLLLLLTVCLPSRERCACISHCFSNREVACVYQCVLECVCVSVCVYVCAFIYNWVTDPGADYTIKYNLFPYLFVFLLQYFQKYVTDARQVWEFKKRGAFLFYTWKYLKLFIYQSQLLPYVMSCRV